MVIITLFVATVIVGTLIQNAYEKPEEKLKSIYAYFLH